MVISNHSWEEETRKTLTLIQTELNDAQKEYEEAKTNVDRLTREAEAMELALQIHLRRTGTQDAIAQDIRELLANQKNHEERIKKIAERNNGVLKVGLATDILCNYGLIKSKSRMNAYRTVYGLMLKMVEEGIFKKTRPGVFMYTDIQTSYRM